MSDPVRLHSPNPLAPTSYGGVQEPAEPTAMSTAELIASLGPYIRRGANAAAEAPAALWGSLPPNARNSYLSLVTLLGELSPGAAIRDAVDASGRTTDAVGRGDVWGSLGGAANLLTAMAGVIPGSRAACKAVAKVDGLPMDETARLARAKEQGFDQRLYHGTSAPDFPAFSGAYSGRSTGNHTAGVAWSAENPEVANYFASLREGGPRVLPLLSRSSNPKTFKLRGDEGHLDVQHAILDAFDAGHDAVRMMNYTAVPGLGPQTIWAFKEPNQVRSWFAKFDPAKASSSDLLAGVGGLTAGGLGLGMLTPSREEQR